MVSDSIAALVRHRKVWIWFDRNCVRHNLWMVEAGHRNLANDFSRSVSIVSGRSRVMSDRNWRCRQFHGTQHGNDFSVLILQASIVSIDADHTGDNEEQH